MDRRRFIELGIASVSLALTACGGGSGGGGNPTSPPVITPPVDDGLKALSDKLQGTLITPSSSDYNSARVVYNTRFDHIKPQAIVRCASADDVVATIAYAKKNGIAITPRCGAHGYAGYSTTTGMVIDVSPMDKITLGNGTATVGAGARLVDVYDQLTAQGVAIPLGSCATVGISGLTLGGGIGVVDRAYGLTCDNLIAAEVVLADGRKVTCDATTEPDLFWALRGGGGGNFGIVTSFTYQTHPTRDITVLQAYYDFSDYEKVMDAWQNWPNILPDDIWAQLIVSWSITGPSVYLRAFCLGSEGDIAPFWNQFKMATGIEPISSFTSTSSYRDTMLSACGGVTVEACHVAGQTPKGTMQRNAFAATSDFFAEPIPLEGMQTLKDYILKGEGRPQSGMIIMDLMGGAINNFQPTDTAFVHRDAIFSFEYYCYFVGGTDAGVVDAAQSWLHNFRETMKPWSTNLAYVNYIDPLITDWKTAYYGENYTRLAKIKTKYDPDWVFRLPQGVEPG